MWIGDSVSILKPKKVKRNKKKLHVVGKGTIIHYIGQVGLADETSVFLVKLTDGTTIEVTEDFLRSNSK